MSTEERVKDIVVRELAAIGGFLVDVKINPNSKIIVHADKKDGITIAECASISRSISRELDGTGILELHEVEVSSPGIDHPFKVREQYERNSGRNVRILMKDGEEVKGKLSAVLSEAVLIERSGGNKKKKETQPDELTREILFEDIKETRVIIAFK